MRQNATKDRETKVYVNFVYSFVWDVTKIPFVALAKDLKHRAWEHNWLYQRFVDFNGTGDKFGSYRPSLQDGGQQVLQRTGLMCEAGEVEIIAPIQPNWNEGGRIHDERVVAVDCSLKYHIRIMENGAGICTFTVALSGDTATYVNTQYVLHLGQNVSFGQGEYGSQPLALSFLRFKSEHATAQLHTDVTLRYSGPEDLPSREELTPQCPGGFTLHEVLNRLLILNPDWFPSDWVIFGERKNESVWLDWSILPWQKEVTGALDLTWQWQNPYVFTIVWGEVGGSIFPSRDAPDHEGLLRRVAVLCKMNSDNRHVHDDWKHISLDYVWRTLPSGEGRLKNMSHDDRIFFSFSRRGGLIETADPHQIPGYFVLPSFVNLLEILRSRWHLGNFLNAVLDQTIEELVASAITPTEAVDHVFHWRALYSMFRRDPVPYLFDGGSVTEISDLADREFWLGKLESAACGKIETIDRLVQYRDFQNVDWSSLLDHPSSKGESNAHS